jgi:hypothetical protein
MDEVSAAKGEDASRMLLLPAPMEAIVFTLPSRDLAVQTLCPLLAAAEARDIVVHDVIVLTRGPDGGTRFVEIDKTPELASFVAAMTTGAPRLSMADVVTLGAAIQPDSTAVFLAYESRWSISLEADIALAGGHVLSHALLPSQTAAPVLPAL